MAGDYSATTNYYVGDFSPTDSTVTFTSITTDSYYYVYWDQPAVKIKPEKIRIKSTWVGLVRYYRGFEGKSFKRSTQIRSKVISCSDKAVNKRKTYLRSLQNL